MAVPVFVAAGSGASPLDTTSFTASFPAGVQNGDVAYFCAIQSTDESTTLSWPSGFVEVQRITSTTLTLYVAEKVCDGSESSSSVTATASDLISGHVRILVFRGARTSSPRREGGGTLTGSNTTVNGAGVTTTQGNELVLWFCGYRRNAAGTAPGGDWVSRNNSGGNTARIVVYSNDTLAPESVAGATHTIATAAWATLTFALFAEPISASAAGAIADVEGSATAERIVSAAAAGLISDLGGSASAERVSVAAASGAIADLDGSASAERVVVASAAGVIAGIEGAVTTGGGSAGAERIVDANASGTIGALDGDANAERIVIASAAGSIDALQGTAAATIVPSAGSSASGTIAGIVGSASAVIIKIASAQGSIAALVGHASTAAGAEPVHAERLAVLRLESRVLACSLVRARPLAVVRVESAAARIPMIVAHRMAVTAEDRL